jgi:hypothetical protein
LFEKISLPKALADLRDDPTTTTSRNQLTLFNS